MNSVCKNVICNSSDRLKIIELIDKLSIDKIILASSSLRRKDILNDIGLKFNVFVSNASETNIIGKEYSDESIKKCAMLKAEHAYNDYKKTNGNVNKVLLISADTVVVNKGIIIGKPKNKEDAIKTLKNLSYGEHSVITAICIYFSGKYYIDIEKTIVSFRKLSDIDITNYIDEYKPFDKAGSYGIQDEGFDFVDYIDGNIDNVIGFPLSLFKKMLNTIYLSSLEK